MNISGEPLLSPHLLARASFSDGRRVGDLLPQEGVSLYRLGRDALAVAASRLPAGPVLVPAYVCREAVEPLAALGRDVCFYRLDANLDPDWDHLAELGTSGPAALLLVHYFGFASDLERAAEWCRGTGVALIEDCAHSFLTTINGKPIGTAGDAAIFSYRKQLPLSSGAGLRMNGGSIPGTGGGGAGIRQALRQMANWAVFKSGSAVARRRLAHITSDETGLHAAGPGAESPPGMDAVTRRLMAVLARQIPRIRERRRANYAFLAGELRGLPETRLLFPKLMDGTVPWALPLVADEPAARDDLVYTLLEEGIGAWEWPDLPDGVTPAKFPFEHRLAETTVLLPVHQDLADRQLRHIADTVSGWAIGR
ncbi:MAG: DegT/DnrJ/EryC1/StrS family aminotransferase [Dehalococcoidia bacterium]